MKSASFATGASLTAVTLTVTFPVASALGAPVPSSTVYSNVTVPFSSWAGVKVSVPSLFSVTVPLPVMLAFVSVIVWPAAIAWPSTSVIVRSLPSTSLSLASGLNVTAMSSFVATPSIIATGASLVPVMVMVALAVSIRPADGFVALSEIV